MAGMASPPTAQAGFSTKARETSTKVMPGSFYS
jgi:hypothetical protein